MKFAWYLFTQYFINNTKIQTKKVSKTECYVKITLKNINSSLNILLIK